ncbi:Kunitz-type U1-aranetoxin-Av1a [Lamellibrachia satsuma]|nr:Kunitz-type U1-aranetoxin-Av1a [Lamellibrachia satsuma]
MLPCVLLLELLLLGPVRGLQYEDLPSGTIWLLSPNPKIAYIEHDYCELPKIRGPCRVRILRYYFDRLKQKCRPFHYGGCRGNKNNFKSFGDCQSTCRGVFNDTASSRHRRLSQISRDAIDTLTNAIVDQFPGDYEKLASMLNASLANYNDNNNIGGDDDKSVGDDDESVDDDDESGGDEDESGGGDDESGGGNHKSGGDVKRVQKNV